MDEKQDTAIDELKKALSEEKSSNSLIYIFQRVRILTEMPTKGVVFFTYPPLIKTIRFFLADRDREVRVAALRTLRYMAISEEVLDLLASYKILHFIVRCFETEGKNHEKIEACKFVKSWLEISPGTFPKDFMSALVALGETENEELKEFAVEAIRILCVSNPKLVYQSSGVRVLVASLIDNQILIENHVNTILTLIYLLNTKETRVFLKNDSEILKIFSIFTNFDHIFGETEFNSLLALSKLAIKTMSKSWVGLLFLSSRVFPSFLLSLTVPCDIRIKVGIIETLEDILNLQIDTSQHRQNLLKNYLALLTKSLIDSGIVSSLNRVIDSGSGKLALRSKNILKKIYNFATDLLPIETLQVFNTLTPSLHISANFQSNLKTYNFLYLCCESINKEPHNYIESSDLVIQDIYNNFKVKSLEGLSFSDIVKKSKVLEESFKWDWEVIKVLVYMAETKETVFAGMMREKVFRALVNYFTPSRQKFSALKYHPKNFDIAEIGRKVFLMLCCHEDGVDLLSTTPVEDFFMIRISFFDELKIFLEAEVMDFLQYEVEKTNRLFTKEVLETTMSREYLKWLGLLTFDPVSLPLLSLLNFDTILLNLSLIPHISSILLPYLNYHQVLSQHFISISLQSPSRFLKHQSLQQIHLLSKAGGYNLKWSIQELVTLIHLPDPETSKLALNLLSELNQDPDCLQEFIQTRPQDLNKFGQEGKNCLMSLLSSETGVNYLKSLNFIANEIENWDLHGHENYINQLEAKSESGLNLEFKSFALEIFTPFKDSVEDRAHGLWLSRIPFFAVFQVLGKEKISCLAGVHFVNDEVFVKVSDLKLRMSQGDVVQVCLMVAGNFVNNQGNEIESPNWVKFDVALMEKNENFESFGVVLKYVCEKNSVLIDGCSFRVRILPKVTQKLDFPLHLYAELSKTQIGFDELLQGVRVDKFIKCLEEDNSVQSKRIALWALGNIGSTEIGSKYLKSLKAVDSMAKIAEESDVLSLRGAAFQSLCLISSNPTGRALLKSLNWLTSDSNVTIPSNCKKIFSISHINDCQVLSERNKMIDERLKLINLTEEQSLILENILNVSNFSKKAEAEAFLRAKRQQNPEVFENFALFDAVMEHLALFSFNLRTRKMVHKLFEKIYRSQIKLEDLIS